MDTSNIGISILKVSKLKSFRYNIMAKILISVLCSVTLGIPNSIIKLSQGLRLIYVMDQYDSIVNLDIM